MGSPSPSPSQISSSSYFDVVAAAAAAGGLLFVVTGELVKTAPEPLLYTGWYIIL